MFQLRSECGFSLGVPSPSRLLRIGKLDGSCPGILAALSDRPDVSDPSALIDECRLPGFVEKLS